MFALHKIYTNAPHTISVNYTKVDIKQAGQQLQQTALEYFLSIWESDRDNVCDPKKIIQNTLFSSDP